VGADRCPCGRGLGYEECCGCLHRGGEAPTAELLMRSRYAAFAVGDVPYLLRTWHTSTRPARLELDADVEWLGLDVIGSTAGSAFETEGTVEFVARFRVGRREGSQHERSRFTREDGRWRYVGELPAAEPGA
jgi:SEC-C motif-containing protein